MWLGGEDNKKMAALRRLDLPYSMKNIPILSQFNYEKLFIYRAEDLAERMRWAVIHDKQKEKIDESERRNTYDFRTSARAPACPELKEFEDDLFGLIRDIERRHISDPLQDRMKADLTYIKSLQNEIVVCSDKTSQLYIMNVEEYKAFQKREIMKNYRRVDVDVVNQIDTEAASLAHDVNLDNRIEGMALQPSFLTIKDHKEDFPGKLNFRLINPAKPNPGQISKSILDRANAKVREETGLHQWRSTKDALVWFGQLEEKNNLLWLKFDIESFYPSISEELLKKTIDFLKEFDYISDWEEDIIFHSRKSILVGGNETLWQKKDGEFDVTMGSKDGAEVCESVGLYLLHKLSNINQNVSVGLYRDDGLAAVRGSKSDVDRIRKQFTAMMKEEGLNITVEGGSQSVDFLDVVLNLNDGSHHPFVKPNTNTKYVSTSSNHPDSVLSKIQEGVCKRLSFNSSDAEKFHHHSAHFDIALKEAGHPGDMKYIPNIEEGKRKNRQRC